MKYTTQYCLQQTQTTKATWICHLLKHSAQTHQTQ